MIQFPELGEKCLIIKKKHHSKYLALVVMQVPKSMNHIEQAKLRNTRPITKQGLFLPISPYQFPS